MNRPTTNGKTCRHRLRLATAGIAACMALLPVSGALAAGEDVIADCNANNGLTGNYSPAQLNAALQSLPTDVDEYSDCRAIIRAALSKGVRKVVDPPAILASKHANKQQLARIKRGIEQEIDKQTGGGTNIAGTVVVPAAGKTLTSAAEPGMPLSMAIALLGIALIGVAELAGRIRNGLRDGQSRPGPGD